MAQVLSQSAKISRYTISWFTEANSWNPGIPINNLGPDPDGSDFDLFNGISISRAVA